MTRPLLREVRIYTPPQEHARYRGGPVVTGERIGQLPEPGTRIIHVVEKDDVAPSEAVVVNTQIMHLVLVHQAAHGGPGVFYLDGIETVLHARGLAQQPAKCFESVLVLVIVGRRYHAQDGPGQPGGERLLPHQRMLYQPYGFVGTEQGMALFETVDELVEPGRVPHPVCGCIVVQSIAVVTVESLVA